MVYPGLRLEVVGCVEREGSTWITVTVSNEGSAVVNIVAYPGDESHWSYSLRFEQDDDGFVCGVSAFCSDGPCDSLVEVQPGDHITGTLQPCTDQRLKEAPGILSLTLNVSNAASEGRLFWPHLDAAFVVTEDGACRSVRTEG